MKYYIIAGEASGDLHGSNLIRALQKLDPKADIRCWGGDKMAATGAALVKHIRDLAFMGFVRVVRNLPAILSNIRFCKEDILAFSPDIVVFIDYPGFNMRLMKWAKQNKYKTVFYISPQVWAWKESRVKDIKKYADKLLVIFPFEQEYYRSKWNYVVEYVGHPLVPVLKEWKANHPGLQKDGKTIALLPGSRRQEIQAKLPLMLKTAKNFPEHHFIVAKAPGQEASFYESFIGDYANVSFEDDTTYSILMRASAALVTSGTATLETALMGVPQVVCYKTGNISYEIGRRLIKLKFICIVNLIMNKEVVKELIQHELTVSNLTKYLRNILENETVRKQISADYKSLAEILSVDGNASENAAQCIYTIALSREVSQNLIRE